MNFPRVITHHHKSDSGQYYQFKEVERLIGPNHLNSNYLIDPPQCFMWPQVTVFDYRHPNSVAYLVVLLHMATIAFEPDKALPRRPVCLLLKA